MKTLETPRLLLRPFTLDDIVDVYREIYSDSEVIHYYSGLGVQTLEQVQARLASHMGAWADDELGRHAVILKDGNELIGQVHLNGYVNSFARCEGEPDSPFNPLEVELAFAFGQRSWGQGYAFEACSEMIRYAFKDLWLRRLVGGVHMENTRSVNLHRRLGYRVELAINPNPEEPGYVMILDNRGEE